MLIFLVLLSCFKPHLQAILFGRNRAGSIWIVALLDVVQSLCLCTPLHNSQFDGESTCLGESGFASTSAAERCSQVAHTST